MVSGCGNGYGNSCGNGGGWWVIIFGVRPFLPSLTLTDGRRLFPRFVRSFVLSLTRSFFRSFAPFSQTQFGSMRLPTQAQVQRKAKFQKIQSIFNLCPGSLE